MQRRNILDGKVLIVKGELFASARIMVDAFRALVDNFVVLLRIAVLPLFVVELADEMVHYARNDGSTLLAETALGRTAEALGFDTGLLISLAVVWGGLFVSSVWIAVGWHRYILLDERPIALWPRWNGVRLLSYLWRAVLIGLLLNLISILLGNLASFFTSLASAYDLSLLSMNLPSGFPSFAWTIFLAVQSFIWLRIGLVLPAAAVGKNVRFREAWQASQNRVTLLLLLVASILLFDAVRNSLFFLMHQELHSYYITKVGSFILTSLSVMIQISILTTLYGHLIEGRELNA